LPGCVRLFLDSNVVTAALVSSWGLDKALLSLCAARICRLVLAEVVRHEVEENLLLHVGRMTTLGAEGLLEQYHRLITLTGPELVPYPEVERVRSNRHLIRHAADVPIVPCAMDSRPDWVLTHNAKHFTKAVAERCGLRIAHAS
jgi:hypothetical protein